MSFIDFFCSGCFAFLFFESLLFSVTKIILQVSWFDGVWWPFLVMSGVTVLLCLIVVSAINKQTLTSCKTVIPCISTVDLIFKLVLTDASYRDLVFMLTN